jgi:integral membrane protein
MSAPLVKGFRLLSVLEGLSLITLLFIAMPAKYQFGHDFVWPVGMAHGVLWLAYVLGSLAVSHVLRWSVWAWGLALLCSVLPFGFLLVDARLRRALSASSPAPAAATGAPPTAS